MGPLAEDLRWLSNLLYTYEAAAEPTWQLQRIFRDTSRLSSEIQYWKDVFALQAFRNAQKQQKLSMRKDANEAPFHHAFIETMKYAALMSTMIEDVAFQIVERISNLKAKAVAKRGRGVLREELQE